MLKGKEMIFNP